MDGWISVEERLPELHHRVWCITAGNIQYAGWLNCANGMWFRDGPLEIDVTHWMPLPEPPE